MVSDSPLMQMLSGQMRYLTQRQGVLAENIANIDTPGYRGRDLKPLDFADMAAAESSRLALRTTSPKHNSGIGGAGSFAAAENRTPYEVNPMKNSVSVEEEMAKISQTGAEYQMASSVYKKFTQLYRSALGNR